MSFSNDEVVAEVWNHFLEREDGEVKQGLWVPFGDSELCFDGIFFSKKLVIIGRGEIVSFSPFVKEGIFSLQLKGESEFKKAIDWENAFTYRPGAKLIIFRTRGIDFMLFEKTEDVDNFNLIPDQFVAKHVKARIGFKNLLGKDLVVGNAVKLPAYYKEKVLPYLINEFEKLLKGSGS